MGAIHGNGSNLMTETIIDQSIGVSLVSGRDVWDRQPAWANCLAAWAPGPVGADPRWLLALAEGLGHFPYCLEARCGGDIIALLPLSLVSGPLFGRFLVSLPYVSTCGILGAQRAARPLCDAAVALADELRVKHLELRMEVTVDQPSFVPSAANKVLMRRDLPATVEDLWSDLDCKVRNQIRKGEKQGFDVAWGRDEHIPAFYEVFFRNMRDLGTPVLSRRLFLSILRYFPEAEICMLRLGGQPVASALLIHGPNITEVPSASALRQYHSTNANMFMYWQLLRRAVERGQHVFDFGRSTAGSGPQRFKAQWGAEPTPAVWQCYYRSARPADLRKESKTFAALSRLWQWLPVGVAELVGPVIVRGIP
jgi:serine/alanine adding enzyme